MTGARGSDTPRRILITGASNGLGAALALHYARQGVELLLVARNVERLEAVAQECRGRGAHVRSAALDICDTPALTGFVEEMERAAPIDTVIANAGIEASLGLSCEAEALSDVVAQLRTNLEGAIATVQPLLEPMRARGQGRVAFVASLAGLMPLPDQPAYCASKAGLIAYGDAIRPWLARSGVSVTVACPGFIATGMKRAYVGRRPFEWSAERAAAHIARAIDRGQARVAFPGALVLLIRLGRLSPAWLRDLVIRNFFRLSVQH